MATLQEELQKIIQLNEASAASRFDDSAGFDFYGEHVSFYLPELQTEYAFRIEFDPAIKEERQLEICRAIEKALRT